MNVEFPIPHPRTIHVSPKAFFTLEEPKYPSVYDVLPKSPLFKFPQDNAEVAVVNIAGFLAPFLGWRVVRIQVDFPDATYEDIGSGVLIKVEFETLSSTFVTHGHDPKGCDYIMCWEDNLSRLEKENLLAVNPNLKLLEVRRIFLQYDFDLT